MITEKQLLDNYRKVREKYKNDPETLGRLKELVKNQIIDLRSKNTQQDTSSIELQTYGQSPETQEMLMDTSFVKGVTPEYEINISDEDVKALEDSGNIIDVEKEDVKDMSSFISGTPTPFEIEITFDNGSSTKVYANKDYNKYDMSQFIKSAYSNANIDTQVSDVKSTISTDPVVLRNYQESIGTEEPLFFSYEAFPRATRALMQTEDPEFIRATKLLGGTALDMASAPFRVAASAIGNIGEEDYMEKFASDIGRIGGEESEDIVSSIIQDIARDPLNVFTVGSIGNIVKSLATGAKTLSYKAIGRELVKSPNAKKYFTAGDTPKVIREQSEELARKLLSPTYKSKFTDAMTKVAESVSGKLGQVAAGAAQAGVGEVEDVITGGDRYDGLQDVALGALGQLGGEAGVKLLDKGIEKLKKGVSKVKLDNISDVFKRTGVTDSPIDFDEPFPSLNPLSGTAQVALTKNKKLIGILENSSAKVVKQLEKVMTADELSNLINLIGSGFNLLLVPPTQVLEIIRNVSGITGKDFISVKRVLVNEYEKHSEDINKAKNIIELADEVYQETSDIYGSDANNVKKGIDAYNLGKKSVDKYNQILNPDSISLDVLSNYDGKYSQPQQKENKIPLRNLIN